MFPALAMVLGFELTRLSSRALAWMALPLGVGAALLLAAYPFLYDRLIAAVADERTPRSIYAAFGAWVALALATFAAGGIAAFVLFRIGNGAARTWGIAALSLFMLIGLQLTLVGNNAFRHVRSSYDILADAQRANGGPLDPAYPVFQVHGYDQTLPFYLQRATPLVEYRDEMALGLAAEPQKGYGEDRWRAVWDAAPQAYALMSHQTLAELAGRNLPMRVLARDPRRAFIARR